MRVAAVLGQFPKLSERFLAREMAELVRGGLDLHVLSLERGDPALLGEEPFASLGPRSSALPPCWSPRMLAAKLRSPLESLREFLLIPGYLRSLPDDPGRTLGAFIRNDWASLLLEAARREGCDLIWANWASLPGSVAWAASIMGKVPLALSCHAWDVFVNRALVRAQLKRAAVVTTCTRAAADHLREVYGADAGKVQVVRHGVRVPDAPPPPRTPPAGRPPRVLGLGRLVAKKGFRDLIAAAPAGNFEVELIGDGPELDSLRAAAAARGAADRVQFRGQANAAGIEQAFERCDAICAPSVLAPDGDRDGVPNCLLEASLAGLPVIASDAGGLPEFAEDGRTALVVPAGDPRGIADAVGRLANEDGLAARLVSGARALIRERFDLEKNAARLAELLREAAG